MSAAKKKLDTDQVASDLSESAFFPTTSTQVHKTTSTQVDKPAKPLVEKYTTHLLPSQIKAIKVFAAEHGLKDYEIVQAAITEYLERQKDPDLSEWVSSFALQEKMKASQVITQALREFREKHK